MSYILPVTHFQYNDYQRRTIQEKGNKHFIESPFKVILEKEHQEISTKYDAINREASVYMILEEQTRIQLES